MGNLIVTFLNLLACKKCVESNLASVITTIKVVQNSLVFIRRSVFKEPIKNKIIRSNFIAVLFGGSRDSTVVEKESSYVLFVDPHTFQPTL